MAQTVRVHLHELHVSFQMCHVSLAGYQCRAEGVVTVTTMVQFLEKLITVSGECGGCYLHLSSSPEAPLSKSLLFFCHSS